MSNVFPKNKEKRSRTSSGESNNSFVKNVTSRVSGLLPATITKWFSSPSSSANGSAPAADATDSSTEDEGPESPITTQPPAKRMRYNSAGYGSADASCVTNNIETIESSTQYTVQSPPGRTTFRRETNFVSTPVRPEETTIDRTTDGPTLDRSTDRTTIDRTDKDTTVTFTPHTTAASIGLSASKKRKSLFGEQTQELSDPSRKRNSLFGDQTQELSDASQKAYVKTSTNTFRDPRQPTFKPTLLGSPFYAGKTTYGGAASSYINQPNISQRQSTTVKEAPRTSDSNMSTSARRILELLESYSSPLMDARRIPHYTRPTRQEVLKRHSESSSSLALYNNNNNSKSNSYKTQELHVPSIASILRLKQRSRLNDSTNAARQLIASHSSSSPDYLPYPTTSKRDQTEVHGNSKLTTKVKTRRTRLHGGEANTLDTETITPVELPKAVLQIDPKNLPNFRIPVASKPSSIDKPAVTTPFVSSIFAPKATDVEKSKSEKTTSNSIYNFANPVRITSESPKTTSTIPKFTFVSPERSTEKPVATQNPSEPSNLLGAPKESEKKTETSAPGWNCPDCLVKNKSDVAQCVCCGHKHQAVATAPAKCTLCKLADSQAGSDKCVNCAKVQVNNIAKPLKVDTTAKWPCNDCWASNDNASEKCACCGAANPKKGTQIPAVTIPQSGGMCSKCFSTKGSDGTCIKCAKNTDSSLKPQANKWECEHCLVRNDSDKTKCVCCEAERSGLPKQPEKKQFNFGTINTTFKFGIDPKVQEANLAKISEKQAETKDKTEESETNNNVLAKAPLTFSFGIPAKKSEDQPDAPAEKAPEVPTFTFALPKKSSVQAPSSQPGPIFGIPNNLTDASKEPEKKDKTEEKKPEVNDKPVEEKKADEPAKPVMTFGSSPSTLSAGKSVSQPLSAAFTLNKDAPSNPLSLPASSAPAPVLTFSAATTDSAKKTGLFGAVASSAPATSISFAPPASTTSLSMFQKTDEPKPLNTNFQKNESAPVSLFAKSDTPAAAPAPTATPMFSFGSTQAQSTDKPSFNFTFGSSNKSDMFKPPTFAATDSSTAANKFTLGSTGTENPLAPASMPGPNGLPASSMTSNSLGGNGLSVNPLAAAANPLSPGNGIAATAPSIFGSVQKESSWTPPNNSTSNLFTPNAATNSAPKPFSFGSSTPFNANAAPAFGANTQTSTPAFGANNTQTLTPAFGANNAQTSTPAFGANTQTSSPAFGANNTQTSTPAFGASNTQTSTPAFGANTQTSSPAFGANNAQTSTPAFGSNWGATSPPAFGASQPTPVPAFGSNVQSTPNIFGISSQSNQPSIFSSPNQSSTGMFGSGNAAGGIQSPPMGMFGLPNVAATPTFGTPNPSIPTFEAPSLPAQAPPFNFGTPQTSFVFGQQQQQQQQTQQTGVYNFGAPGGAAGVQFSMGTSPNQAVRRVRRPARRVSQR